ncbi:50S ribosomal protein L6 [Patescibacteria group bacterium]|nr:50S ribosomal protein L6 [Patescibacteria group bacterium]MBU1931293.1 50S ribosomal protein L6 [Patescibacteria group bacterium]
MSKIGQAPITIPDQVKLELSQSRIQVNGPKGKLSFTLSPFLVLKQEENQLRISRKNEQKSTKAMHGLTRSLIYNMILGVTQGFVKILEIEGTGFRVAQEGDQLSLTLGFSHPVLIKEPEGIKFEVPDNKTIKVVGIDKQLVGQVAAQIRSFKKPDPYKAKGVRYQGEHIRRKAGKAGKAGEAAAGS